MNHGIVTDERSTDVLADGDLVIITHPVLRDAHVVARVEGIPTKSTCLVTYWQQRRNDWSEEGAKRRKLGAIIGKVGDNNPARTAARLTSAEGELRASYRRADQAYYRTVKELSA